MKKLIVLFLLLVVAALAFSGQLMKRHTSFSDVDREFDEIFKSQVEVVVADRAPSSNDNARVGTFWIWKSSTTTYPVYVRFPTPAGWRKIITTN